MKFKPRRSEEPEINVVSLIDVVLLLVVFFMLSSNFTAEGRMRIRLPQASSLPQQRPADEALVVTVSASGSYLVNARELVNSSADTLRCGDPQDRGRQLACGRGDDPGRRPGQPSVGGHGDGCAGPPRIHADECRHGQRARSGAALEARRGRRRGGQSGSPSAARVYGRLLRYAWPYRGMYLIGVVGMILYAATDLVTLLFIKTYLQNTIALEHNPKLLELAAAGVTGDLPDARRR